MGTCLKNLNKNVTIEFNQIYKLLSFKLQYINYTIPVKWQTLQQLPSLNIRDGVRTLPPSVIHPFVTTVKRFQLLLKTAPSYVRQEFCICLCASISLLCNIYGWFQSRNIVIYACLFYLWAKYLKRLEKHLWWSQVLIKFQVYNHDTLMAKKYQVFKSL